MMFKRYNCAINTLLQPFAPRRVRTEEHVSSRTLANAHLHTSGIFVRQVIQYQNIYSYKEIEWYTYPNLMKNNC